MSEISSLVRPVTIQKVSKIVRDSKHREQKQKRPKYPMKEDVPKKVDRRLDEFV